VFRRQLEEAKFGIWLMSKEEKEYENENKEGKDDEEE
jgi:hypothetical protein